MRKLCVLELLSPGWVKASSSVWKEEVGNSVTSILNIGDHGAVNVTKKILGLTATMTTRATFGAKFEGTEKFMKVAKKAIEMYSGFSLVDVYLVISRFIRRVMGMRAKLEGMHKEFDEVLSKIVEENQKKRGNKSRIRDVEDEGLLDILLSIYDDGSDYSLTISMAKSVIFSLHPTIEYHVAT